ncbi:MAG: amidophosphoribosyltransferase [Patescibacteria group bacterium]|nr:amidophosphoribosyltransferase [Patescibacteria group bacterium]
MCGIIGIASDGPVAPELYESLVNLQHRGSDSTGMVTFNGKFSVVRGVGYVREAYTEESLKALKGNFGIAHTRYTTTGSAWDVENTQPFLTNSPYGIALVHNGNLTNYQELKNQLQDDDHFHCNSDSDSEALLGVFASELRAAGDADDFFDTLSTAVARVYERARGGYAVAGLIADRGVFAFRDPHGIRPLVVGKRARKNGGFDYAFASENTPFAVLGFELVDDVAPGELAFVDKNGELRRKKLVHDTFAPDVFEYIYFARPDAVLNKISVYRARLRMGQNLAARWKKLHPDIIPDLVVPVPFTSNPFALSFAHEIGVRYSEALYRNVFVGRTFLMPGMEMRAKSVNRKLTPLGLELEGKDILIVDDSIVRGVTSREVVQMVRKAGARKVYFVSACPPIKYPDFYGIDIPTTEELIASHMNEEEIRKFLGVDILVYQTIEDLTEAILRRGEHGIDRLSMPYLDGWYVTGDVDAKTMDAVSKARTEERGYVEEV